MTEEIKTEEIITEEKKTEEVKTEEMPAKKKLSLKMKIWLGILILFLISLPGYYCGLTIRKYEVKDARIQGSLRIALVTDLHSCKYGKGQKTLLEAIDQQKPDVILLGGDIFDDDLPDTRAEEFLAGISGRYPCYYVTGNHECWAGTDAYFRKMAILEKYKIDRLTGNLVELKVGDAKVLLGGLDDPQISMVNTARDGNRKLNHQKQIKALRKAITKKKNQSEDGMGTFTILLTHRPELIEEYVQAGVDLALAGHAHGGQVRIPFIMNGLFVPDQGLFPKYAGGFYEHDGMKMIISRGLARESTPFPRFCNPPELVIIDLSGE